MQNGSGTSHGNEDAFQIETQQGTRRPLETWMKLDDKLMQIYCMKFLVCFYSFDLKVEYVKTLISWYKRR